MSYPAILAVEADGGAAWLAAMGDGEGETFLETGAFCLWLQPRSFCLRDEKKGR